MLWEDIFKANNTNDQWWWAYQKRAHICVAWVNIGVKSMSERGISGCVYVCVWVWVCECVIVVSCGLMFVFVFIDGLTEAGIVLLSLYRHASRGLIWRAVMACFVCTCGGHPAPSTCFVLRPVPLTVRPSGGVYRVVIMLLSLYAWCR